MKLIVIAVGTKMPKWVEQGWQDYVKRMPSDCAIDLKEIKPEPRNIGKTVEQMMAAESKRILAAIPERAHIVVLDEHGKDLNTQQLSQELGRWQSLGNDVVFLVGGPDGLDTQIKALAQQKIRLSSLTLPHPMVRVLLAEQLYRAWSLLNNHPYHRA